MKHSIKIVLVLFSIIIISCKDDRATIRVADFSKPLVISQTLEPNFGYPYAMMNIWVEGYTNDTIMITLHSKDNKPILKLSGEIKERWYTDYYGEGPRTIIFESYKATKGELEIKFEL